MPASVNACATCAAVVAEEERARENLTFCCLYESINH